MVKNWSVFLLTLFLFTVVRADIAPPDGYKKVSTNLNIETKEDLTDYRFFLDFYGDVREVEIKKGANSISSMGGARYSSGTLWAVPKKSLKDETKEQISQALQGNKLSGAIKLTQYQFSQTVSDSEADKIQSSSYLLERDAEKGLKLTLQNVPKKSGRHGEGIDFTVYSVTKSITPLGYIVLIGTPLALIILGIWLFRKRGRKLD
ncbi:MAG: hypothetical protein K1X72_11025 [Pyrinomonadaceae bacterium]|nr:hypothetical protein [Pyrinomonadaceae bacterium]